MFNEGFTHQLTATQESDAYLVRIGGDLDWYGSIALEIALIEAEQSPCARILLDIEDLTFADSRGLVVLLKAAAESRENGDRMRITRGKGQVARLFHLAGVDEVLPFVTRPPAVTATETEEQAIPNGVVHAFAETREREDNVIRPRNGFGPRL